MGRKKKRSLNQLSQKSCKIQKSDVNSHNPKLCLHISFFWHKVGSSGVGMEPAQNGLCGCESGYINPQHLGHLNLQLRKICYQR